MADRSQQAPRDGGAPDDGVRWVSVDAVADDGDASAGVVEFGGRRPAPGWYRYRTVAAVAVGLVVAVGAVVVSRDRGSPAPEPSPTPSVVRPTDGADVFVGPVPADLVRPVDEPRLPVLDSRLPRAVGASVAQAVPLSASPVTRALALFQDLPHNAAQVVILGEDHWWRWLDVVRLSQPTDRTGNAQQPLDSTSLSPSGTHAAFAQRDGVVVVDLTTARAWRYQVAGSHEEVIWQPDGTGLYLLAEDRTLFLDIHSGRFRPTQHRGMDLVVSQRDKGEAFELLSPDESAPAVVRRWSPDASGFDEHIVGADLPALRNWWGAGWRSGRLLARAAFFDGVLPDNGHVYQAVAVVDGNTGAIRRLLGFATSPDVMDRWNGCCEVMGWLSGDSVLVAVAGTGQQRILAWNIRTGELARVMDLAPSAIVALADLSTR